MGTPGAGAALGAAAAGGLAASSVSLEGGDGERGAPRREMTPAGGGEEAAGSVGGRTGKTASHLLQRMRTPPAFTFSSASLNRVEHFGQVTIKGALADMFARCV